MARVVETEEPAIRERQTVVHEDRPRNNTGLVLLVILILILLFALLAWRPWSGGGSTTNVNVPSPSGSRGY